VSTPLADRELIARLTERERQRFTERTPISLQVARRAVEVMPLGVPTNVSALEPYPLVIAEGAGAYVCDVDGNRYCDYANGFGTSVFGHANTLISEAIAKQAARGTHFGALTMPTLAWAEELCFRYELDWVRFASSGTEATMDAIRLARALSGRELIAKIEGGYHGSHPEAMVSTNMELDASAGSDDRRPKPRLWGRGLPHRLLDDVAVLPFNDLGAAEELLQRGQTAAILIEPILFNVGAVFPEPGYLEGLRELCDTHGTLLIFDETKTAATVAFGGATELFGVEPDLKTLGKGIGGGLAVGAIGGRDERGYRLIESGQFPQLGTFPGNPLVAAAGHAALCEILTPAAYDGLEAHRAYLTEKLERVIAEHDLPAYVIGAGAKACIVWADPAAGPLRDYRDYRRRFDFEAGCLAWLYLVNEGILLAPGQDEQLTFSVAHGPEEAELLAGAFAELAAELRG
jgi:glutamate-1-semialdehyde 2,1-aminomutase